MLEIYNNKFSIEDSICWTCRNRFSRTLRPVNPYDYFDDETSEALHEAISESTDEPVDEIFIEQHVCLIATDDIIDQVVGCTHYDEISKPFFGAQEIFPRA